MPLVELHALVENLQEKIQNHSAALSASEALTRYALIDPLLRELGWETANPAMVVPEYVLSNYGSGSAKRADYALLYGSVPVMMVEAKSLGSSLRDAALSQGIQYCLEKGTKYFALTDGNYWEICESHLPVPIEQKRVIAFDLCNKTAAEACLEALALWRPSLELGNIVSVQTPLVRAEPEGSSEIEPAPPSEPNHTVPQGEGWQRLSDLQAKSGDAPPAEIRFPDNSRAAIKYWRETLVELVRWLVVSKQLDASHCPIRRLRTTIIDTRPQHPSGSPFRSPQREGSLYIETHGNLSVLLQRVRAVIEAMGLDPASIMVRFG